MPWLVLLDDVTPSLDTYYLFRRRICDYYEQTHEDLLQQCFEQITGGQIKDLRISGKCVRMDSKLIGGNTANTSRYELIHRTLAVYLKSVNTNNLPADLQPQAEACLAGDSPRTVYRSDKDTLTNRLNQTGEYIHAIWGTPFSKVGKSALLQRFFDGQYMVVDGKVLLRDKKSISANSLQSPF